MNRKGLWPGERGTLTVYAAVVLVPLLLFQLVLLDFVRIRLAEAEEEAALRSAVRSVLSAYDPSLRDYGLFGLVAGEEEMAEIAAFVMQRHGSPADGDKAAISLVKRKMEHVSAESVYTLADHRIFHRQMLEEMKLKAPIEFTRHLYRHWQNKAEEIEGVEQALELAEETEKLLKKRDKALRDAFDQATRLEGMIREAASRFHHIPGPVEGSGEAPPNPAAVIARQAALDALRADGMRRFAEMQRTLERLQDELKQAEESDRKLAELLAEYGEEEEALLRGVEPLGSRFFTDYEQGAAIPVSMFGAFVQRISYGADPERMAELNRAYREAYERWYAPQRADEERRRAAFDELERKKKEKRKEVKSQMDEASAEMSGHVCAAAEEALYARLLVYEEKYIRHNEALPGTQPDPAADLHLAPDDFQRSSLGFLTDAAHILEKIRDEVYVNEYVMYYFNYRTSETEAGAASPRGQAKEHALAGQEAEYVLYGLPSCTLNRAAAYAEMYAVRFAIRLVEALLDARRAAAAVGSPLLVFLTAAVEAAARAHEDMQRLIRGEAVPVFAKTPALRMGYADYLRLFLAVHSNETGKMARLQALIELNTGIDLAMRPAYIALRSESALRLWFLPGAAKLVRRAVGLQGRIEDNRYRISKRAEMAY